jgi:hypothetical protein
MPGKSQVIDKDKGLREFMRRLKNERWQLTVGVHGPEGGKQATGDTRLTVLDVATINEFGLGVPERSFIRDWYDQQEKHLQDDLRKIAKANFKGVYDTQTGLERFGLKCVGEVQARIKSGIPPANAPSTIAKKGSSTPLIDKGQLWTSVTFKVTRGKP